MVRGFKLIESFNSLIKLEVHAPFSVAFSRPIADLFPLLENLELTVDHDYETRALFPMPETMKVLRILCYALPLNGSSHKSLSAQNTVPLLPTGLEAFTYRCSFLLDTKNLTWPAGLTDLDLVALIIEDNPFHTLPALERLKLLIRAPSRWVTLDISDHLLPSIPKTVRHLSLHTDDHTVLLRLSPVELSHLDLISLNCSTYCSQRLMGNIQSHADLYKQMPNLQLLNLFLGNPISPFLTKKDFDYFPTKLTVAGIDTGLTGVESISRLPSSVLSLSIRAIALPLQKELFTFPNGLVSLTLFSPSPVDCDFPETLTAMYLHHCTLSERVLQLPKGLKRLECGENTFPTALGFALLPPHLESLKLTTQGELMSLDTFSATLLPKTLTSLEVILFSQLRTSSEGATYGQKWWSTISPDLPLRLMRLEANESTAEHGPLLIPRLPRTLRSLSLKLHATSNKWALTLFQMLPSRLSSLDITSKRAWLESEPFFPLIPRHLRVLHLPYWNVSDLTKMVDRAHIANCAVKDTSSLAD